METAIGVFASRDSAEASVKELLQKGVPESSLVFLTRSESEAKTVGKQLGAFAGGFVGGAAGMTAGVAAATLLLPGIGAVFALGASARLLYSDLPGRVQEPAPAAPSRTRPGLPSRPRIRKLRTMLRFSARSSRKDARRSWFERNRKKLPLPPVPFSIVLALSMEGHAPVKDENRHEPDW